MAEAKLDEFLREQRRSNSNGEVSSKMTFDQAAAIYLRSLGDNLNIKPRTREYWREVLAALLKSWLRLNETEAAQGYDARSHFGRECDAANLGRNRRCEGRL